MAITITQSKAALASPGTSVAATFDGSVVTGAMVVVAVASYQQDPGAAHVTDSKGNTYTRIFHPNNGNIYIAQYAAYNVTGGASFAVTFNPTTSHPYTLVIAEVSITGGGAIDVSATNTGNATPAFAMLSGTTGATANAEEICFACFSHTGGVERTVTGRTAGWTNLYERDTVGAWDGFAPPFNVDYKVTSSTGTQAETINWENGDNAYVGGIAAYKAAGGGGPVVRPNTLALLGVT